MNEPNYYAILPATIRYSTILSPMEKIIYAEITALTNKNGYCFAKNRYFGELYGVHKNTVGNWINNLKKNNFIRPELKQKFGKKFLYRINSKYLKQLVLENKNE